MSDYHFERISRETLPAFCGLFEAVHGRALDVEQQAKKFDTRFAGTQYVGYLAFDAKRNPAAFYGVFPCLLSYEGQAILGAQSGDTMTHPDHQRKGLFVRLAKETFQLAKEERIRYLYGIPNQHSYPGFMKLGWTEIATMRIYRETLRAGTIRRFANKGWARLAKPLLNWKLDGAATGFPKDTDWVREPFAVRHDAAFFEYKQCGENRLLPFSAGYAWVARRGSQLWVGDVLVGSEAAFWSVWEELSALARSLGLNDVVYHVSPHTHASRWAEKRLGFSEGLPVIVLDLDRVNPKVPLAIQGADYDTF